LKGFLLKLVSFSIAVAWSVGFIFWQADGRSDSFYLRFTTPKQNSLILGSSRSAQGLQPQVFNQVLFRNDIYNYSFTVGRSPFGPAYLKGIKKKLMSGAHDGIYIIGVDPWLISNTSEDPNNVEEFGEKDWFLGSSFSVCQKPNFPYLIKDYDDMYVKILINNSLVFLHDDGWLEVKVKNTEDQVREKIDKTVKNYTIRALENSYSKTRMEYLGKTIEFLKQHGKVYLIRLPIPSKMKDLEDHFMPDFNLKIDSLARKNDCNYLDLTKSSENFKFNDGSHLTPVSGKEVSKIIANWINSLK